jgi:hypothetical protein
MAGHLGGGGGAGQQRSRSRQLHRRTQVGCQASRPAPAPAATAGQGTSTSGSGARQPRTRLDRGVLRCALREQLQPLRRRLHALAVEAVAVDGGPAAARPAGEACQQGRGGGGSSTVLVPARPPALLQGSCRAAGGAASTAPQRPARLPATPRLPAQGQPGGSHNPSAFSAAQRLTSGRPGGTPGAWGCQAGAWG